MGTNGHKGKDLIVQEEQILYFQEFKQGQTYEQIAAKWETTPGIVGARIKSYLQELRVTGLRSVAEYRQVQIERLQAAYAAIWPNVIRGNIGAVNALVKLMEREAKLIGLDAPTKVDITARIAALGQAEGFNPEEAIEIAEGVYREIASGE